MSHGSVTNRASHRYQIIHIIRFIEKCQRKTNTLLNLMKGFYIDLRRSKCHTGEFERVNCNDSDLTITTELKNALTKKIRLRVTGYYQGDYMYMLGYNGLIMN